MPWRRRVALFLAACLPLMAAAIAPASGQTAVFRDCDDCPDMVAIPGQPFAVGRFEVTAREFAGFLTATGQDAKVDCAYFDGDGWSWTAWQRDDRRLESRFGGEPAVCVNWEEARHYTRWLSEKTGQRYRLPRSAEWDIADRAGSTATYHFGDAEAELCEYGNIAARNTIVGERSTLDPAIRNTACSDRHAARTARVGSYRPNAYGIYDTIGNVREWVADCFTDAGATPCEYGTVRGGSLISSYREARSEQRTRVHRAIRSRARGFRVLRARSD